VPFKQEIIQEEILERLYVSLYTPDLDHWRNAYSMGDKSIMEEYYSLEFVNAGT